MCVQSMYVDVSACIASVCVQASVCVCSSLNNGPHDFPHLTVFGVLQGLCVGSGGENVVGTAEGG